MRDAEDVAGAVQYAYRLLGYRQRSIRELEDRLGRKGYSVACIQNTVRRLTELGYLDDRAFARLLLKKAEEVKNLGRAGARHYFQQMGIPRGTAAAVLEAYDEFASARRLVQKKARSLGACDPAVARRRLLGYLQRRGFSAEVIRKVLNTDIKEADTL